MELIDNFDYFCRRVRGLLNSLPTGDDIVRIKTKTLFKSDFVCRCDDFKYMFTDTPGLESNAAQLPSLSES